MSVTQLIWGIYLFVCVVIITGGCTENAKSQSVTGALYIWSLIYWCIILIYYAIVKLTDPRNKKDKNHN